MGVSVSTYRLRPDGLGHPAECFRGVFRGVVHLVNGEGCFDALRLPETFDGRLERLEGRRFGRVSYEARRVVGVKDGLGLAVARGRGVSAPRPLLRLVDVPEDVGTPGVEEGLTGRPRGVLRGLESSFRAGQTLGVVEPRAHAGRHSLQHVRGDVHGGLLRTARWRVPGEARRRHEVDAAHFQRPRLPARAWRSWLAPGGLLMREVQDALKDVLRFACICPRGTGGASSESESESLELVHERECELERRRPALVPKEERVGNVSEGEGDAPVLLQHVLLVLPVSGEDETSDEDLNILIDSRGPSGVCARDANVLAEEDGEGRIIRFHAFADRYGPSEHVDGHGVLGGRRRGGRRGVGRLPRQRGPAVRVPTLQRVHHAQRVDASSRVRIVVVPPLWSGGVDLVDDPTHKHGEAVWDLNEPRVFEL